MNEIEAWIAAFARERKPGRLLDVGCGTKPYEALFPGWAFVGIDVAMSGRPSEQKSPDAWFDGRTIPYQDAEFDCVLCTEVLEHAEDPVGLTQEMFRVLRPGGEALVSVPFMWGIHEAPYDFRRYSPEGIRVLLEEAGFVVERRERSQPGIAAISALVASEIRAYEVAHPQRAGPRKRLLDYVETALWRSMKWVWAHRYAFDRLYVDNLVVASRPL